MKIKFFIIALFIIFYVKLIYTSPLREIYEDIIFETDPSRSQDGITYSLTEKNLLKKDFLIQFPGKDVWGKKAEEYPGFEFNASLDNNFGLPHCETDSQCTINSTCSNLSSFNNQENHSKVKMCNGYAEKNLDRFYNIIIRAEKFVDITTLEPMPDLRFRSTLRNALTFLARTGKHITIRILSGSYQTMPSKGLSNEQHKNKSFLGGYPTWYFLNDLIRDIKNIPESNLNFYVSSMRSCSGKCGQDFLMSLSWNHSKIIDVDGKYIISGGVNMYDSYYLGKHPVFDLMIELEGPVATQAIRFTNLLWRFVRNNIKLYLYYPFNVIEYSATKNNNYAIVSNDLLGHDLYAAPHTTSGNTEILAIGRTGYGLYKDDSAKKNNNSDYALYRLLISAKKRIYIAQQSLKAHFNTWPYDTTNEQHTNLISALAKLLIEKGHVYIVQSPYSNSISIESGYLSLATNEEIWNKIKSEARAMYPSLKESAINLKLCNKLHISTIRFNDSDESWIDNEKITGHYKFMMVDKGMFYVGSQNFYPSGLQNYGHIINDKKASNIIRKSFWGPLWKYSSRVEYTPDLCKNPPSVI
ncbi:PLD-like domain protein [Piscirickettsia salmonis]|uniref:PLD-like domain protein n=1 Tax=Piscirickettsia salmonis TaxID=1238 RepID=UPI0007C9445C|nr:Phospholipase D precursor [Piscirickettsiaceae bacterium NZ-RLO1]